MFSKDLLYSRTVDFIPAIDHKKYEAPAEEQQRIPVVFTTTTTTTTTEITTASQRMCLHCFTISTSEVGIIERWGKYDRLAKAGCHIICPPMDVLVGTLSFRVQELNVRVESKTLDNVFLTATVSVQYCILAGNFFAIILLWEKDSSVKVSKLIFFLPSFLPMLLEQVRSNIGEKRIKIRTSLLVVSLSRIPFLVIRWRKHSMSWPIRGGKSQRTSTMVKTFYMFLVVKRNDRVFSQMELPTCLYISSHAFATSHSRIGCCVWGEGRAGSSTLSLGCAVRVTIKFSYIENSLIYIFPGGQECPSSGHDGLRI